MLYEPQQTWRPVQRPIPKNDPIKFISQYKIPGKAPPVPPKPSRKVVSYVYDTGPDFVEYQPSEKPRSKSEQGRATPREKVQERSKRHSRGFKVLADVTPSLRANSRGGRMFIKQRNRMDKFTRESQGHKEDEDEAVKEIARKKLEILGVSDTWATPWKMASSSPAAVKYLPANKFEGKMQNVGNKRVPLGFMPRPPTHWRAKVEEEYPTNSGHQATPTKISNPIKVSRIYGDGYATEGEGPRRNFTPQPTRPDSAPINNENNYDSGYENNAQNIYQHEEMSNDPQNMAKVSIPAVRINFNARENFDVPHRQQGVRRGRGVFTTTPYVMLDFNAKPKGWNQTARSYYC